MALAFRVSLLLLAISCKPSTGPGLEPPFIGGTKSSSNGTNAVGAPAGFLPGAGSTTPQGASPGGSSAGGQGTPTPATTPSGSSGDRGSPMTMGGGASAGTGGTSSSPSSPNLSGAAGGGAMSASSCVVLRKALHAAVHLVVDASSSTVTPNDIWSPLGRALGSVLAQEASSNLAVGAQLFQGSCDPSTYTMPAVPIGPLAGARETLASAMSASAHQPGAATTLALSGALTQAEQWAQSSEGSAAVVLISGSEPTACFGSAGTAALVAASGLSMTPPVTTHVVALGARASLDQVAQAGGTGAAVAVSDPTSEMQLLAAVQSAVSQAACTYALPSEAAAYVPDRVNLEIEQSGASSTLPRVDSVDQCDATAGGWYYDDAKMPTSVVLCAATCAKVTGGAGVSIAFGCPTVH